VRSSLDLELDLDAFHMAGALGFRLPLRFGQVSETRWFPRIGVALRLLVLFGEDDGQLWQVRRAPSRMTCTGAGFDESTGT